MQERSVSTLVEFLGHDDQRIRQRAQFELARRRDIATFARVAGDAGAKQLARVHALWGMDQLRSAVAHGVLPLRDRDAEIRAQAARVAGDLRLGDARDILRSMLKDEVSRVRFQAAIALGKLRDAGAVPMLAEMLAENDERDPFLRHAAVMGLAGASDVEAVAGLASHRSAPVRLAAVVGLRRLGAGAVSKFLQDPEPVVRREAARAIHDDAGIEAAMPALAALLDEAGTLPDEGTVRRVLNANLRLGTAAAAERLGRLAGSSSLPDAFRAEAVECLASWSRVPAIDRVEGMVRPLGARDVELGSSTLRRQLDPILAGAGEALSKTVARVVMQNRIAIDPERVAGWVASSTQPTSVRAQALELLAEVGGAKLEGLVWESFQSGSAELRMTAMRIAATRWPAKFVGEFVKLEATLGRKERQLGIALVGRSGVPARSEHLSLRLNELLAGKSSPEFELDVVEACRAAGLPELKDRLAEYESRRKGTNALVRFKSALIGGDAATGREVFRNHSNAQCVRCHEAGGEGYQAGPVLAGIGKRVTPEYLLEALIDPSRSIAEGFATVSVVTRDGEVTDGTKVRETGDEVVLRLGTGEYRRIPRRDIEKQSASAISAMPPMGEVLNPFELRDVLAYLQSLR